MIRQILKDLRVWAGGWRHLDGSPYQVGPRTWTIDYKPGWGPVNFGLMYATTYLAGTLVGYGVVSLSRAWYERSKAGDRYPFAKFMTRFLNWLLPGKHGIKTGGWLWGTASRRNMVT